MSTFDKTVTNPNSTIKENNVKNYLEFGINLDLTKLQKDLEQIKNQKKISLIVKNYTIGKMLNSENIILFRKINNTHKGIQISISKSRSRYRKIIFYSNDYKLTYLAYLDVKQLCYNLEQQN